MWQLIFFIFFGLCSGIVIAGGVAGLMIGLSIVPRYAGITHTARFILLYEDMTLAGIFLGNLFYLFQFHIPGQQIEPDPLRSFLWDLPWRMDTCTG